MDYGLFHIFLSIGAMFHAVVLYRVSNARINEMQGRLFDHGLWSIDYFPYSLSIAAMIFFDLLITVSYRAKISPVEVRVEKIL